MNFADVFFTGGDGLTLYARDYAGPAPTAPVVLCLHGLTRNSKDFDGLARHLQARARVVAPDMRGRGRSARDADASRYRLDCYVRDVIALLDLLRLREVHLVGTSMGGLISLLLIAAAPTRVRSLVLNDIGPAVEPAGLARIAGYVGRNGAAPDWATAAANVRRSNAQAFPDYGEADWLAMARDLHVQRDGEVRLDYDPAIAEGVVSGAVAPDLWEPYRASARRPTLVLRGDRSDLLSARIVERMRDIDSQVTEAVIPDRGHAPTLNEPASRQAIDAFLAAQFSVGAIAV